MERILVTGATGHIGGRVVRELLAEGRRPVAFVRASSSLEGLPAEVERRVGDVLDPASLDAALAGCDAVIHCAAQFALWARREEELLRPTVEGTRNVLEAAARAGIRRVVYTSSAVAVGFAETATLRSERDWAEAPRVGYYKAKLEAERAAHEIAAARGLALVSLCPTLVLGAGDYRVTPSMRLVLDLAAGRGVTFDGGGNVVSVGDVARAHVRALTHGAAGDRFVVGGENLTVVELGALVARRTGRTPRHLGWPRWALGAMAALVETGAWLARKEPALTRAVVHDLIGKYAWYDCSRARATFGLEPTPAAAVVDETLDWFVARGLLAPFAAPARAAA